MNFLGIRRRLGTRILISESSRVKINLCINSLDPISHSFSRGIASVNAGSMHSSSWTTCILSFLTINES